MHKTSMSYLFLILFCFQLITLIFADVFFLCKDQRKISYLALRLCSSLEAVERLPRVLNSDFPKL